MVSNWARALKGQGTIEYLVVVAVIVVVGLVLVGLLQSIFFSSSGGVSNKVGGLGGSLGAISILDAVVGVDANGVVVVQNNSGSNLTIERISFCGEDNNYSDISLLSNESKKFFIENWKVMIISLTALLILFLVYRTSIYKMLVKRKIDDLSARKESLRRMIMKTQKDYFEGGSISESLYTIRTKSFAEMIRDIDRQIPLLQEKLFLYSGNLFQNLKYFSNLLRAKNRYFDQHLRLRKYFYYFRKVT
jgi:hypothetical protein